MKKNSIIYNHIADFSIVLGGPLYQLYLRSHLVKPALQLCYRRILVLSMLAWLPLLLLTLLGGTAFCGSKVPFFFDIETHVRFLGSLSLLIAAEVLVHKLVRLSVSGFVERSIITSQNLPEFDAIITSSLRLRNSVVIELLLVVIVFSLGHWIWKEYGISRVGTWFSTFNNSKLQLTPAGYWYVYVSLPLFQFILLRWYFRILVWYRFLWKVSRLPLYLNSLHPDKMGGLGFLINGAVAFAPVLLAHTILLAGMIANYIWHDGATILEFKFEIVSMLAYLMLLVFMPLSFFLPNLVRAKQTGLIEYGDLASQYVNDFQRKWIDKNNQDLLGNADIQSLADLSNSYNVGESMRLTPFSWKSVTQLLMQISIPFLPLILPLLSLDKIVSSLLKVIL